MRWQRPARPPSRSRPAAYLAHDPAPREEPIRVAIVGGTGYAGGELIRLLERHPYARIVGVHGRGRSAEPIGRTHGHLARTGHLIDEEIPDADAVFLAMPHGVAAAMVPDLVKKGARVVDLGPDFRLHDPADYPLWYHFEHPATELLAQAVYGLPELHRDEIAALRGKDVAIVGAPGCFPTTTILALAPLARAGLIGDLVVDAKTGVSGAGRDPRPDLTFSEVNESVRAYGLDGHRHTAEIEQELLWLSGSPRAKSGGRRRRFRAAPRAHDPRDLQHRRTFDRAAPSRSTSWTSSTATPTPTSLSWSSPTHRSRPGRCWAATTAGCT